QGNRHLLSRFVATVVGLVPADREAIDLYAGVGVFAVGAAIAKGVRVTAGEGDRDAAAELGEKAAAAGGMGRAVHQSVEGCARGAQGATGATLLVDPPRTGLSREAMGGVLRLGCSRLIYASCDVATLARDARRLVDGGYEIAHVEAFDLFPNTPHVETVVAFAR